MRNINNYIFTISIIISIILHYIIFNLRIPNLSFKKTPFYTTLNIVSLNTIKNLEKENQINKKKEKPKLEIKQIEDNLEKKFIDTNIIITNYETNESDVEDNENNNVNNYFSSMEVDKLPSFIKRVDPEYPFYASVNNITGKVYVDVWLDSSGKIQKIEFKNRLGYGIEESIEKALKQSIFAPAYKNNTPVNVIIRIPYVFKLE